MRALISRHMYVEPSPQPGSGDQVALRVLQAGAIAIVLAATPYKAFDLDRYFVPKELVLLVCAAVAAFVVATRLVRVSMTAVDLAMLVFLVASLGSAVLATNPWAAERALAISTGGAALFWCASSIRRSGLARPLLVAMATAVVIGAITSLAQAYGVRSEYFSLNRAPGGTFGNRNFVAHLCAIGTPAIVFAAVTARRPVGAALGVIGMVAVSAVLAMSRSRAAWLAVIVSIGAVVGMGWLSRGRWRGARTVKRLTVIGIGVAVGALAAVLLPNRLEWKSGTPYLDSAIGLVNYKEGSGRGRLVQYTNSLRMTAAHPVLGVGPGNWPVVYPRYASRGDPSLAQEEGTTANPWPSSDWIAYMSERGVIGLAALAVVLVGLLRRALSDVRFPRPVSEMPESDRVVMSIALVGTLGAAIVVGSFDAALIIAVPAYFTWTLAGALAPPSDRTIVARPWLKRVAIGVTAFCGSFAVARSAGQLAAIATFGADSHIGTIERAAWLDPGSYRIHLKLAQAYVARGECARARPEARTARALFPNAAEPKRVLAECGAR
jgi:O-antigen ligase